MCIVLECVVSLHICIPKIDALSKRSKVAETACLNLYRKLIDIPGWYGKYLKHVFFIPQTVDSIPVLQQAISIQQRLITMQVVIVGSCDLMCFHVDLVGYGY